MIQKILFILLLAIGSIEAMTAQNTQKMQWTTTANKRFSIEEIQQINDTTVWALAIHYNNSVFTNAQYVYVLLSMHTNGSINWAKEVRIAPPFNSYYAELYKIEPTVDGNFVIYGRSYRNLGNYPYSGNGLLKITPNGDVIWAKYIESQSWANTGGATTISSNPITGGYTVCGDKAVPQPIGSLVRSFNIQLDENANLLVGTNNQRFFKTVGAPIRFTNFLVDNTGSAYQLGFNPQYRSFLAKLPHNATSPIWIKELSSPYRISYVAPIRQKNGHLLLVGSRSDTPSYKPVAMAIDTNGTVVWLKEYNFNGLEESFVLDNILEENGFTLADVNGTILNCDEDGNPVWARNLGIQQAVDAVYCLSKGNDNGYWVSGEQGGWNTNASNGLFIKTDDMGRIKDCCGEDIGVTVTNHTATSINQAYTVETDSLKIVDWPLVLTPFSFEMQSLCAPTDFMLPPAATCTAGCLEFPTPILPPGAMISWELPAGASFSPDASQICFSQPGDQPLILQMRLNNGCLPPPYTTSVKVTDSEIPMVFTLSDSVFCPGLCAQIQLTDSTAALFTFAGGSNSTDMPLEICYNQEGQYSVFGQQVQEGCLRRHNIDITVENVIDDIPNAFTPGNGDDFNDGFRPIIDCVPTEYLLRIFDRWGNKVYETTDWQAAWDGTVNGTFAPVDTYIWTVQSPNLLKAYKGEVTIVR